jgi:hypothetical protein
MAENEGNRLHFAITRMLDLEGRMVADFVADVKSLHLPSISKKKMLNTVQRSLYAMVSVKDCASGPYEISSLDGETYVPRPMTL